MDTATTTVCGVTTSFSPFTIVGSPAPFITRTGFYSPVNMVPGFVNTAKGGSTIPLKFNVYVNGVEKKDTAGLQFSVASVACATLVAEDPVDSVHERRDEPALRRAAVPSELEDPEGHGLLHRPESRRPTASRSARTSS